MSGDVLKPLSNDELDELLDRAARSLEERHVVPETGKQGARVLGMAESRRRYRELSDSPDVLAETLTSDLRLASGDNHLFVEHLGDDASPADDWIARWRQEGPSRNWGVHEVRLLPGNIGLLKITSFYTYELAVKALEAAMELVRHTDGLVLDLTDNGGGDDATADAVMDTFIEHDAPRPLVIESRDGRKPPRPPTGLAWPSYGTHRPLVITVNHRTFSAPEAVAYALQQEERAVVIGSRSGGGANMMGDTIALAFGFRLGVPTHRPVGRVTNTNWEGIGIQPDEVTSGDAALWRAWEIVRLRLADAGA